MAKQLNVSLAVTADTSQAKAALQALQTSLTELRSSSNLNLENLGLKPAEIQQASSAIVDLQSHLKAATNINTGNLDFSKLSMSLKSTKSDLVDYGAQLLKLGPQGQQAFQQLTQSIASAEVPINKLSTLFGQFGTVLKNTVRWQISSSLIHGFIGSIQSAFNYAQNLNKSLNNIQIVTGNSNEQMAKFAESANKAAKSLSTTTVRYTDASLIYYQQGIRDDKEIAARTETTIKLANVSGQSAEKVSDQMTAIWNNFAKGSGNLEYYADVITALGAATASSSEEIATGLEKFASIADTVGLSYENASAALATITATTRQSADTVGTGLRTLFSRLQSLSLGETLEDGVNLTKYTKALQTVGVSALDASGNLRSMDSILEDLGSKWDTLTSAQQTALAQTVGGVRQYTTLIALMDNFDFYKQNQQTALNSKGTLQKQADIYAQSWEAASTRVRASAEAIYSSLLNDKFFIQLNNGFAGLLNVLNSFIKSLGGVKGILFSIGTIATTLFKDNFTKGLYNLTQSLQILFTPSKTFEGQKTSLLNSLIELQASPNTENSIVAEQQRLTNESLKANQFYAMNKANMTPFQQYWFQGMGQIIESNNQAYSKAITEHASLIDEKSDIRQDLYSKAKQNIADKTEAEALLAKLQTVKNNTKKLTDSEYSSLQRLTQNGVINYRKDLKSYSLDDNYTKILSNNFNDNFKNAMDQLGRSPEVGASISKMFTNLFESESFKNGDILTKKDLVNNLYKEQLQSLGITKSSLQGIQRAIGNETDPTTALNRFINKNFNGGNLSEVANQYNLTTEELNNYVASVQKAVAAGASEAAAHDQAIAALEKHRAEQAKLNSAMQSQQRITSVVSGFMSMGMAITQITGALDSLNAAIDGTGSGFQAFTSILTAMPMAFLGISNSISGIVKAFNIAGGALSGGALAGWTIGIMALITAVSYGAKALDNAFETDEEKLERLKTESENATQYAEQTKQAYDNLLNEKTTHNGLLEQLKSLTDGTNEFYNALNQANSAALELITKYGLTQGTDYNWKNGRIEFTNAGQDNMDTQAMAQENFGAINAAVANVTKSNEETRSSISSFDYDRLVDKIPELSANDMWLEFIGSYRKAKDKGQSLSFTDWLKLASNTHGLYEPPSAENRYEETPILDSNGNQIMMTYGDYWQSKGYNPEAFINEILQNSEYASEIPNLVALEEINNNNASQRQSFSQNDYNALIAAYLGEQGTQLSDFVSQVAYRSFMENFSLEDSDQIWAQIEEQVENENLKEKELQDLRNLFQAEVGFIADSSWDKEQIIQNIKNYRYGQQVGKAFSKYIDTDLKEYENYKTVNLKQLQSYQKSTKNETAKKILQEQIDEIINSPSELVKIFQESLDQISNNSNLSEEEKQTKKDMLAIANQTAINNLNSIIKNGTISAQEIGQAMSTIQLSSQFGTNFQADVLKYIFTPKGINKELNDTLSSLNFNNKASSFFDLMKQVKLIDSNFGDVYSNLAQDLYEEMGGKQSGLLSEFFKAENFQESLTSLQKTFKKTGKLSSKDIMDIADSCDILNDYLKYSGQSASTLAGAIEVMSLSGISSIDQISDAFLTAMGTAGAFEDQLQTVFKFIDEFSPDRSIQDIADFFSETSDDMFTELGNGNYGGERLYQEAAAIWGEGYATNLRNFFLETQREMLDEDLGPEYLQEKYSEQFDAFDEVMQTVADEGNMRAYWDFLLKGGGDQILGEEFNNEYGYSRLNANDESGRRLKISEALEEIGITNKGDNGDIEVDLRGRTTKDFTQEVADALGISYEEAELRVQEMSGKSSPLAHDLKRNDAVASLSAFGDQYRDYGEITAQGITEGFKKMSWAERTAFLKEYGDVLTEVDDYLGTTINKLNDERKAQEAAVATARAAGEDMSESIGDIVAAHEDLITTTEVNGKTQKDFGKTMENLQAMGYTQEEVFSAIKDGTLDLADAVYVAEDAFGNKLPIAIQDANGELKSMETILSEAEQKIHDSNVAHDAGIYAQEFKKVFSDSDIGPMDVEINVTDNGTAESTQSKIDSIHGTDPSVNVSDDGTIAKTQSEIDDIDGTDASVDVSENGTAQGVQSKINDIKGKSVDIPIEGIDGVTKVVNDLVAKNSGKSITVSLNATTSQLSTGGYVPFGSAANGVNPKSNRKVRPGLSLTGEEGPEIVWNKYEGYSYVVGEKHPEFITLYPGDRVFNAQETKKILSSNALGGKVYESNAKESVKTVPVSAAYTSGVGPKKKSSSSTNTNNTNTSSDDFTPERYHLITRQITELTRLYDLLSDKKEKAYGTNKLEAIQDEIDATNKLIDAQKSYIKEIERYIEEDKQQLSELSINVEFDAYGNIANYDELQNTIGKAAAENKDDETLQDQWDAIEQYEETIDEFHNALTDLQDKIYDLAELQLERITEKREMKIDFDERDLKLIEHFTKKIDDNIYDTARVLSLAGMSLDKINDKIEATKQGVNEIFENMVDSQGNPILDMTLEKFLSLSEAERDALNINSDFGEQLEEYSDDLLDYIDELNELKIKGIDELNTAFNELNGNISDSMDLFNYYNDTLDNLKNIIDLQGVTISKDLRDVFQTVNQTMLSNNTNNIQAEFERYNKLQNIVSDLQEKLSTVTDPQLQKQWEEQLKTAEEELRNSQTNLLNLWQDGLDMAKQIFEQNIDNAVRDFEEKIADTYGDLDGLQAAYDRKKEIDDFYVADYEKYYQISKLQRQINKDLDDAAKNHNKSIKGLSALFQDLNNARESGVELTAYDLDIFAKRYAYEKALMDLENSRNEKQEVRLQRDASGNWGYVYTASEDEDDLIRKQQAVDDALYEWQKATTTEANRYSDEILPKIKSNLEAIADAYRTNSDIPQDILNDTKELLALWGPQFQKTLDDGAQTLNIAIDRYKNANFDIIDDLNESSLAAILNTENGIDDLLNLLTTQMEIANDKMDTASTNYKNQIADLNNFFKEYGEDLGTVINAWAGIIGEDSQENKSNTIQIIDNAKQTFDEILSAANDFEDKFMEKYEPIIQRNEQFIISLNDALDALNRKEFVGGELLPYIGSYIDPSSFDTGGYTGSWGTGGRLAVVHEKENIFSAADTANLLDAAQILRTIDLSAKAFATGLGSIILPDFQAQKENLQQEVHIEASFPSVQDHNEIELAFDNLINKASQYVNRKNMSSMTFQDMYTSKF